MSREELFERMLRSLHACVLDDAEWTNGAAREATA